MSEGRSRRVLQVFLRILGVIAVTAGGVTLILGATSVAGVDDPSPAVDSEMRFYAAWYVAAGFLLLKLVPRVEEQRMLIRVIALTFFTAGCARAISWVVVGRPPGVALALMAIELALPFIILPLQSRIPTGSGGAGSPPPTAETG